jgi:hypothetical protein
MAEITRETVTTESSNNPAPSSGSPSVVGKTYTTQNLIYFIFGVIEFLLVFRAVFKLVGANPASGFVSFIYAVTNVFILPFLGIFRQAVAQGVETTSVLEPATLIAIPVYALLAWGIVKLIAIVSNEPEVGA